MAANTPPPMTKAMARALCEGWQASTAAKRYCWPTPIAIPNKKVLKQNRAKLSMASAL